MKNQVVLKNIYVISHHRRINYIKNSENELNNYLNKNYIVSDFKVSSSGNMNEKMYSVKPEECILVIEVYILEKISNL